MTKLTARRGHRRGARAGRGARRRPGRGAGGADHRHRRQAGGHAARRVGARRALPRVRACWPPRLATMLVVLTTDARRRRDDPGRGAARGHPALHLRPARRRRLPAPPTTRCCCSSLRRERGHPDPRAELTDAAHRGLRRPGRPADGRRRGIATKDTSTITVSGTRRAYRGRRGHRRPRRAPATTCSRRRCSATTPTGAGCSPPSAPPTPVVIEAEQHRRPRSTASPGLRGVASIGDPERGTSTSPAGPSTIDVDLKARVPSTATIWTNDLSPSPTSHENSAYST